MITRMSQKMPVKITVNGRTCEGYAEPRKLLVDFLREDQIGRAHV